MKDGWIIELEPNVYKSDISGVTLLIENAKRYKTLSNATHGLAAMRLVRHFRKAEIYHTDEIIPIEDEQKKVDNNWGHTRTWTHLGEIDHEDLPLPDRIIMDIGWVVGSDKEGRTLYFYSTEQCKDILREYVKVKE